MTQVKSIKGMNDVTPQDSPAWRYLENTLIAVARSYGYQEIRFPILEHTDLFKRSIGEVTDIVEKEMYTFDDRKGQSLTLRPEGTACCVRAAEQNGLLYNQVQKLWYTGPMFRYERPQKGRLRQFHQFGLEAFGMDGPDIDAELLILTQHYWRALGILDAVELQINNLGSSADRARYSEDLVQYLKSREQELDEDSRNRLNSNPLRILDSKVESTQSLLDEAPVLDEYLSSESQQQFDELKSILDDNAVKYVVNPRLVRGLDYYNNAVFEWVTAELGAQGTVCAGGRYDSLVALLGGKSTPAVGCGMGLERLLLLLRQREAIPEDVFKGPDVYLVSMGNVKSLALKLAQQLRQELPQLTLVSHMGGGSFKNQIKKADKSGANYALILGEDEAAQECIGLKPLRSNDEQVRLGLKDLPSHLAQVFNINL